MNKIFDPENRFFIFMGRIGDLVLLNFLFIFFSIPIVTFGASLSAMYYVTFRMVENKEGYLSSTFFREFKNNLKNGIIINLILILVLLFLSIDFIVLRNMSSIYNPIILIILLMFTLLYFMIYIYIYPLIAFFEQSIKITFSNALLLSIKHLPVTILCLIISFSPFAIFFLNNLRVLAYGTTIFLLLGFSGTTYINSMLLLNVFKKYIPENNENEENDNEKLG